MNHESIRYKLQKYENKMGTENNQYKRALYAEKVGHYRNLLQSGGSKLGDIITEHKNHFGTDVDGVLQDVKNKLEKFDPKALADSANKIDTFIKSMGDNFKNVRKDLTDSTIAFAEYNAAVRKRLNELKGEVTGLKEIQIPPETLKQMNEALDNTDVQDIAAMNANADLIGEIGLLQGTSKAQTALTHISTINNDFDKLTTIDKLKLFDETKAYAEKVLKDAKATLNDQSVNQAIDSLVAKMNLTL